MAAALYQAVMAALLQKSVWAGVRHVVTDGAFTETNLRLLVAQIDHLHARTPAADLTLGELRLAIEMAHMGQLREDLLAYMDGVSAVGPAPDHIVRDLLARELLSQAAQKVLDAQNQGRLDIDGPAAFVAKAQELIDSGAAAPTLTLSDFGLPSEVAASPAGEHIPLGISADLDRALGGGLGLGQTLCFVGRANVGKTSIMVATGANMLQAGKNVLHIIVGDAAADKVVRLYERKALHVKKADWTDDHTRSARQVLAAAGGRLWIKDLSGMVVTPDSVESCIRAIQRSEQVPVHCVIIDYLELMELTRTRSNRGDQARYAYAQLCKQVRGLGPKLGTRIVTAWQLNREGSQKDTATEADLSECWDIFKHVDIMVVQNRNESEKANRRMRLTLRKQRSDDEAGREFMVFCEWATMTIEDVVQGPAPVVVPAESGGGVSARPTLRVVGDA